MPDIGYNNNYYKAQIIRWLDGDTVVLRVDLGQKVMIEGSYRLNRINAPEIHLKEGSVDENQKKAGLALKATLESRYPAGTSTCISTTKADRYGRYLVELWTGAEGTWENLNDWLLGEGLVKPYDGRGPKLF